MTVGHPVHMGTGSLCIRLSLQRSQGHFHSPRLDKPTKSTLELHKKEQTTHVTSRYLISNPNYRGYGVSISGLRQPF